MSSSDSASKRTRLTFLGPAGSHAVMLMPRSSRGLAHVNLNVTDVDRSARFYAGVLGMQIHSDTRETIEKGGRPVALRQVVLTTPGCGDLLALTQGETFPVGSGGLNHVGYIFESDDDVRAAVRNVERCGGKVCSQGDREHAGLREAFAYVQDPDGYDVELSTQAILLDGVRRSS